MYIQILNMKKLSIMCTPKATQFFVSPQKYILLTSSMNVYERARTTTTKKINRKIRGIGAITEVKVLKL